MSVFKINTKSHLDKTLFFDEPVDVARYDRLKYPALMGFVKQQRGFFWVPEIVDIYKDSIDFKKLNKGEQNISILNISRQIVLDSVQGRAPVATFGSIVSDPALEVWLTTWQFSETIHSDSYTHAIKNAFPSADIVFDKIVEIEPLVKCADHISKYYDKLTHYNILKENHDNSIPTKEPYSLYEHKKALWLALNAVNVLEGIRFYNSFAASWAFAETKRMEGIANIIKLICRDENLHLGSTQLLLKLLPKDDNTFVQISEECKEEVIEIFRSAVDQEIEWAEYVFQEGSMLGLNTQLLTNYTHWIANKRMKTVGLPQLYKTTSNPLPWTEKWISGSEVQVAPQETNSTQYTIGKTLQDMTPEKIANLRI